MQMDNRIPDERNAKKKLQGLFEECIKLIQGLEEKHIPEGFISKLLTYLKDFILKFLIHHRIRSILRNVKLLLSFDLAEKYDIPYSHLISRIEEIDKSLANWKDYKKTLLSIGTVISGAVYEFFTGISKPCLQLNLKAIIYLFAYAFFILLIFVVGIIVLSVLFSYFLKYKRLYKRLIKDVEAAYSNFISAL